ncbi:CHAT domain-containing protein, partial [Candidatus Neomarinimicrobiota bacterium]
LYLNDKQKSIEKKIEALNYYGDYSNSEDKADDLEDIGYYYSEIGNYESAKIYANRAINIYSKLNNYQKLFDIYSELALIEFQNYNYDESEDLLKKANVLLPKLGGESKYEVAMSKITAATLTASLGRRDIGFKNLKIAIEYIEANNLQEEIGMDYIDFKTIAALGLLQENIESGADQLMQSIKLIEENNINNITSNIALGFYYSYYSENTDIDLGISYFENAINLYDLNPDSKEMGASMLPNAINNLGFLYWLKGDREKGYQYVNFSISLAEDGNDPMTLTNSLTYLSLMLLIDNQNINNSDEIIKIHERIIQVVEDKILNMSSRYKMDLIEHYSYVFDLLAQLYLGNNRFSDAIKTIERGRNNQLIYNINKNTRVDEIDYTKLSLDNSQAIVYINISNKSIHPLYRASLNTNHLDINDYFDFDNNSSNSNNLFVSIITNNFQNNLENIWEIIPWDSTSYFKSHDNIYDIVNLYNKYLSTDFQLAEEYSKYLYSLIIKPIRPLIDNYKDIILILDPLLSNIPFESLIDDNGKYLIESFNISYNPSLTVLKYLQDRKYNKHNKKTLFAIGGVNFNNNHQEYDQEDTYVMRGDISEALYSDKSLDSTYNKLGYGEWSDLPGSEKEIDELAKIFDNAKLLKGDSATEKNIKELSETGNLTNFSILHFATHAFIDTEYPGLSALVMADKKNISNEEDGYLNLSEISNLALESDLVTLSACKTGLGKKYINEGIIGLPYAFLIAGSNAITQSLWPVEDQSTSDFMIAFYKKIANGKNKIFALSNTKREFISGKFGEEYKKPFYWAPFIYLGVD